MSVDGREEPRGGGGSEVEAGSLPARQVPAQRDPGGRHARPSGSSGPGGTGGELPPSDGDLIARMRGGDDGAYEELFRRHADSVRRYARSCCRDAHTADDLTAEVFARTLQAVRGGAGPDQSVRAYLLTTVRRVAAAWAKTAKREQLVEDFAVFAEQASTGTEGGAAPSGLSGLSGLSRDDTLELGADVRAMHEAERSLAMQAFRSLPERWQAVLWHTTVEEASPSSIAPLFGLSANATAVLASRAREGLKQAYLQAHVSSALSEGGDCARYADRLGAYARGGLRMRAERGLRKHLEECVKCRLAAGELQDVNAGIPALLPVAVIGWFAAGYAGKAAGVLAGGAVAAGGAAAAAAGGSTAGAGTAGAAGGAGGGAAGAGGGAGGSVAAEGLGLPAKAAIAAGIAVAAAAGVVFALAGDDTEPGARAKPAPSVAAPAVPSAPSAAKAPAATSAPAEPDPPAQEPQAVQGSVAPRPGPTSSAAASASTAPGPAPSSSSSPSPSSSPSREKASPTPSPERPSPKPTPTPTPPPKPPQGFQLAGLAHSVHGDHSGPELQTWRSGWVWQRHGLEVGGRRFAHGITVNSRSSVEVTLNRQCTSFSARAGVDGLSLFTDGAVRFSVYADGERVWQSGALGHEDPPASVQVSLAGRKSLRLVVEKAGPGRLPTLASWADAVISCR
ncbi:sigma-70 family RNA polymerase sigma factor [Streptomyces sp. NBC_01214]|uniref:sigma-70 family RNA polymerase sigma factor n=1 Tax=Streptomyces sp. NBC_01214 TaxID=2903777 RepID=UPI00224DF790|nr:sigma-70 family RNA polymerase sigma factor [Streptomyces sp. NBC_01214]MCX4800657.1 sigma-70 family RNA polymerase sigma factor [Streptomyces sp. NBC_01214]